MPFLSEFTTHQYRSIFHFRRIRKSVLLFLRGLEECAFFQLPKCLAELLLRVHHDGAVPGDGFFEWLAGDEQEADAVVTGLHRDFVAAHPTGSVGTSRGPDALQNFPEPANT